MDFTLNPPAFYAEQLLRQHYFMIPVPEALERLYIRAHEIWEILCRHYGGRVSSASASSSMSVTWPMD